MSTKRIIFSINDNVLNEFNRRVPLGDRSKTVENFMQKQVPSRESQLEAAAKAIEADADYQEIMQDLAALTYLSAKRLQLDEQQRPSRVARGTSSVLRQAVRSTFSNS